MMRHLILIALLLCLPVRGEAWQVVGGGESTAWVETFDAATGYDKTGWVEYLNPDEDCATPPCPIAGTQSLSIPYGARSTSDTIPGLGGSVTVDFVVYFTTVDNTAENDLLELYNSGGVKIGNIGLRADDKLRIFHGESSVIGPVISPLAGVAKRVWLDYTTNGEMALYVADYTGSETKPGSPYISLSTGTAITDLAKFRLINSGNDPGGPIIFDNAGAYNR
jgi:hypothetical protein